MEEIKRMPYGIAQKVGNFSVLKYNKTLSKGQINALRKEQGMDKFTTKGLQRGGLPYIKVSAISGIWSIEFAAPSTMFQFLDTRDYDEKGDMHGLHNLFMLWLSDTMVMGDPEYISKKGQLMTEFLSRQKREDNDKEDKEALEDLKEQQEIEEAISKKVEG